MLYQKINIPSCNWNVDIVYGTRQKDADMILDMLWDMGCARWHLCKAEDLLKSGVPNQGLTYSDKSNHHTLIVIGYTTSVGEFISTLVHEVDHLTDHISQCYGFSYESESNSHLIGNIAKTIYEDAVKNAIRLFKWRIYE